MSTDETQSSQNRPTNATPWLAGIAVIIALAAIMIAGFNFYIAQQDRGRFDQVSNATINTAQQIQAIQKHLDVVEASPEHVVQTETFAALSDLNKKIQSISLLQNVILPAHTKKSEPSPENAPQNHKPWYWRALDATKQLKHLFVVRHVERRGVLLIDPELELAKKLNVEMQISLAQWALLHHNQKIYQLSLQFVSDSLKNYFLAAPVTASLIAQINTLQKINVGA